MWQILKAELSYTKDVLIVGYTIAVAFLVAALVRDNWGIYNFMWNTTITYFVLMWILGTTTINEKRYRYLTTLPVTLQQLALVDWLYCLLVQAGMVVLWIVYLLFEPERVTAETLSAILANSATILSIVTLFGIHYHLGFFGTKKYKRLNWFLFLGFIVTMIGLGYLDRMDEVARFVWRYYSSSQGALFSVMVCLMLCALSAIVFVRRKSYLA